MNKMRLLLGVALAGVLVSVAVLLVSAGIYAAELDPEVEDGIICWPDVVAGGGANPYLSADVNAEDLNLGVEATERKEGNDSITPEKYSEYEDQ